MIGKFDDILVFSQTEEESMKHLRYVLEKLQQEKMLVNVKKCTFMKIELVYLGFVYLKRWVEYGSRKGASNH